jgi:hypothetical protein
MVNSRNKGAAFERFICKELNKYAIQNNIDDNAKRNLSQYQQKNEADIYWCGFAIECKHYQGDSHFPREQWWKQVCEAAGDEYVPLLIYKFNRKPIQFITPAWIIIGEEMKNPNAAKRNQSIMLGSFEDFLNDLDVILKNVYL